MKVYLFKTLAYLQSAFEKQVWHVAEIIRLFSPHLFISSLFSQLGEPLISKVLDTSISVMYLAPALLRDLSIGFGSAWLNSNVKRWWLCHPSLVRVENDSSLNMLSKNVCKDQPNCSIWIKDDIKSADTSSYLLYAVTNKRDSAVSSLQTWRDLPSCQYSSKESF